MNDAPIYKRILLKISGESLAGDQLHGICPPVLNRIAAEINEIHDAGVEIGIVVGGGNIFRGIEGVADQGIDRAQADYMGMLATVINGLAMQGALERQGVYTRLMSAITMQAVAEPFIQRRAIRHLEKGRIVIFAAGTGSPFFTTDTAAALRATQIGAEALLKATDVDGVFDKDPRAHADAKRYDRLKYIDVLRDDLKVMDATAVTLSKDHNIPIIVFNVETAGNIKRVIFGDELGTTVS